MTVTKKTAIGRLAAPFTVTDGVVTIDAATTSIAGLMTASDKTKLDGIAAGAEVNVQSDWNQTTDTADDFIKNKPTIPSAYTLPTASDTVLGGVKVGSGLAIDGDGVISAESSANHASEHITGGDDIIPDAVASTSSGLLSGVDKAKLDGIAAGANNYSLPTASADVLGGVKIGSGIAITDGVISAATGSSIGWTQETAFTATPASTSTLTMTGDLTGSIKVGMALKYTIASVVYYGVVTAITSNLMTIAGAPMGGDVTALYYSTNPAQVVQVDFFVSGTFADAANDTLLASDMKQAFDWNLSEARLVQIRHKVYSDDSGAAQPRANVSINGNKVSTSNSNAGVAVAESWSSTVVDINTTNYVVQRDYPIEITCDANGTNDDAQNLSVSCVFVMV